MNATLTPLYDAIDEAIVVAYDGCHKIYLALDPIEAQWFRDEYPHVVGGSAEEMLAAVERWWDKSCPLRFINGVRHNPTNPNAGYISIVPQFADEDDFVDEEETE